MEYRRFSDKIFARIDRGEEITEAVKQLAEKENIKLASVSASAISPSAYMTLKLTNIRKMNLKVHMK